MTNEDFIKFYKSKLPEYTVVKTQELRQVLSALLRLIEEKGETKFSEDLLVNLMNNKTFGKYINGQTIPSTGKTAAEVIEMAVIEYMTPSFSTFSNTLLPIYEVSYKLPVYPALVEFYFQYNNIQNIKPNSLNIYDINNSNYIMQNNSIVTSKTANIGVVQKFVSGQTHSWRASATNTNEEVFNSSNITITWLYKVFHGMVDDFPQSSAAIRLMNQQWNNVNQFQIRLDKLKYTIALPVGKTIVSIITQNNEPILSNFTKRASPVALTLIDGVTTSNYEVYDFETATVMNLYANVILS